MITIDHDSCTALIVTSHFNGKSTVLLLTLSDVNKVECRMIRI
jgi:hypothetical protein